MQISQAGLNKIAGREVDPSVLPSLLSAMQSYAIDTKARAAAFLAQIAHESGGFKYTREIWGPTSAQLRYEGRADLGNTEPGDGERFKGRGYLQITGRSNYKTVGTALGVDLIANPEKLELPRLAAVSAAWWWSARKLNVLADHDDAEAFELITKRINGGLNGYEDRCRRWEIAKEVIAPVVESVPAPELPSEPAMPIPAPLLIAGAQALLPFVADLFKKHGGDTAERNAAIVEKSAPILIEAAKAATGQTSIEGAISAVAGSSVAQEQFRKQVESRWFEITEAGGGGVEGARKFTSEFLEAGPAWAKGMLAATLSIIALATVIGGGAMLWAIVTDPNTSPDQRGMIVGALVALIGVPLTYFFGSSASSRSKDAALEKAAGRN